jgi:putative transposase
VVTHRRRPLLGTALGRRSLRRAIETVRERHPFEIPALVLLPDHLHMIWTLPRGSVRYSVRWRRIKEEFTKEFLAGGGREGDRSVSRQKRKERGVWQRRFWEHLIDSEDDFERHLEYIHYNPVKHGLVDSPVDWPYSSFHRWVERGVYPAGWGRKSAGILRFDDLDETAMEYRRPVRLRGLDAPYGTPRAGLRSVSGESVRPRGGPLDAPYGISDGPQKRQFSADRTSAHRISTDCGANRRRFGVT